MDISKKAALNYQKQYLEESIKNQKNQQSVSDDKSLLTSYNLKSKMISESFSISTNDVNKSLNLVYERAISSIDIELEESIGKNAIQKAYDDGIDFSPEATSDRILSFPTSFFDSYRAKNSSMSDTEALDSYVGIIGKAIDKGFGEAREILSSLNVLNGSIKENVDKTYDLIQEGLGNFTETRT